MVDTLAAVSALKFIATIIATAWTIFQYIANSTKNYLTGQITSYSIK